MHSVARDLQSYEDGRFPHDAVDGFVLHLELVYRELLVGEQLEGPGATCQIVCSMVSHAVQNLQGFNCASSISPGRPLLLRSGHAGRPKFDISREQMCALIENGFTGPQVASLWLLQHCYNVCPFKPHNFLHGHNPFSGSETYPQVCN